MEHRDDVIGTWCRGGETEDLEAVMSTLSPAVVLHSPLTEAFSFRGRDELRALFQAVFDVVDDIAYDTRLSDGATHALFYRGRVGQEPLVEAQLIRLADDGLIGEVTLFVRPLPAATALMSAIAPRLAVGDGRRAFVGVLRAATAPLHAMTRLGDKGLVPLAAPRRP